MPIIASVLMNAFPTPVSSIEQAARTHTRVFIISMVWFVVAAVVSGWLTIALWKASNKESDLRIAQANERAENARNAAAAANERAENLENANLKLRGDVAGVQTRLLTAAGEVASLQKEAADSRAAQQRVEVELNRQRERAALAEKQLLEIREARRPRSFNNQERQALITYLTSHPKGTAQIWLTSNDPETTSFGTEIFQILSACGWSVDSPIVWVGSDPMAGIIIAVHDVTHAPPHAVSLREAFVSIDVPFGVLSIPTLPQETVRIFVAPKYVPIKD